MEIRSKEVLGALRALDTLYGVPENNLPEGVTGEMVEYLCELGLVRRLTLVPPGKEYIPGGPDGLSAYRTTEAGREVLRMYQELKRKQRWSRWWELLTAAIGGGLISDLIEKLPDLARWIEGLL